MELATFLALPTTAISMSGLRILRIESRSIPPTK